MSDYEPFYCDQQDRIVHGQRDDWLFCPLCGTPLSDELRRELSQQPEPAWTPEQRAEAVRRGNLLRRLLYRL